MIWAEDPHEQDTINNQELGDQRRSKQEKEKITEEKGPKKAQKKLINTIYCFQIYLSSACVKDDPKLVRKIVKELYSDAARYRFLRRNIEIQTIGFWGEFQDRYEIKWSQNGKMRSVKELSDHLRRIVLEEKNMEIPDKLPASVPERRVMPILGNALTAEVRELDTKYSNQVGKFREDAEKLRRELESKGEVSMYSQLQPWIRPELVNLPEQRIGVLSTFLVTVGDKQKEQDIRCQGVLKSVLKDSRQPFMIVNWDGMPDVEGWEDIHESAQRLFPSLYNKDKEGAWRMDVNVELCEAYESDNDDCDGSDD